MIMIVLVCLFWVLMIYYITILSMGGRRSNRNKILIAVIGMVIMEYLCTFNKIYEFEHGGKTMYY